MKRKEVIPVNTFTDKYNDGFIIMQASLNGLPDRKEAGRSHRDDGHLFILQEKGTTHIEIDFQKYEINAPSVIYIHPGQVHRLIQFENSTLCSWIITSENIQPEFLKLMEGLASVKVLHLKQDELAVVLEAVSLTIKLYERKGEKLYYAIIKESFNTLLALIISQYLSLSEPGYELSRFAVINKAFKASLEQNFIAIKSPAGYAKNLNISTPYLNECVKTATGFPVSYHIQNRIILESQRLLFYSDKSIKEIAAELGYDDYSYFIRLFKKVTGITPSAFRNKNLD